MNGALADALTTIGDRWTLLLIAALLDGPRRFGDLQTEVEGIAPNVLKRGLRYLDDLGYQLMSDWNENPTIVDPSTID